MYRIYLDMDGVLADFLGGFDLLGKGKFKDLEKKWKGLPWEYVKRAGTSFWRNFPKMEGADELVRVARSYDPNVSILTAVSATGKADAIIGKKQWAKKNIGDWIKVETVEGAKGKDKWATPESILIDDRAVSIKPWRAAGGIGIHYTSAPQAIKELHKLMNPQFEEHFNK